MSSGVPGLAEIAVAMDVIRDQGEAAKSDDEIAPPSAARRTIPKPEDSHYQKFITIRETIRAAGPPDTYAVKDPKSYTLDDQACLRTLIDDFAGFTDQITDLFAGRKTELTLMEIVGQDILACWKNGVTPAFNSPQP